MTSSATATLTLPYPAALPSHRDELAIAATDLLDGADLAATLQDPIARTALRRRLAARLSRVTEGAPDPRSRPAEDGQAEHDRYFQVTRCAASPADSFAAGLLLAHVVAYEDCQEMGVTLLTESEWGEQFAGLEALLRLASISWRTPALPSPAGWRTGPGYDPARRWLTGHQLFFSLIQGAIVGLNWFGTAIEAGPSAEADQALQLAAAFMRSSAVAMKLTSDFAPEDYETAVRPAMAPPRVRAGFSGLQTRDHAYLVRLFGRLKPVFLTLDRREAHQEFIESVVSAYAAHEFICARFRGDVLPSLRMEAASRGKIQRPGTAVIREMMRARLALVNPAEPRTLSESRP
jgi:hypothetical protein